MTSTLVPHPRSADAFNETARMETRAKGFSLHIVHGNTKDECTEWAKTVVDALKDEADVHWVGWHVMDDVYAIVFVDRKVVTSAKDTDDEIDIQTRQRFKLKLKVPSKAIAAKLKKAARLRKFVSGWVALT